jgi:hypothetical protein
MAGWQYDLWRLSHRPFLKEEFQRPARSWRVGWSYMKFVKHIFRSRLRPRLSAALNGRSRRAQEGRNLHYPSHVVLTSRYDEDRSAATRPRIDVQPGESSADKSQSWRGPYLIHHIKAVRPKLLRSPTTAPGPTMLCSDMRFPRLGGVKQRRLSVSVATVRMHNSLNQ